MLLEHVVLPVVLLVLEVPLVLAVLLVPAVQLVLAAPVVPQASEVRPSQNKSSFSLEIREAKTKLATSLLGA